MATVGHSGRLKWTSCCYISGVVLLSVYCCRPCIDRCHFGPSEIWKWSPKELIYFRYITHAVLPAVNSPRFYPPSQKLVFSLSLWSSRQSPLGLFLALKFASRWIVKESSLKTWGMSFSESSSSILFAFILAIFIGVKWANRLKIAMAGQCW